MTEIIYLPRRSFIKAAGLGLAGSCFFPKIILAKSSLKAEKRLNLYHTHTGETFNEVFWAEGQYIPENIKLLNRFLRDWRTQEQIEMCPQLFDLLHNITQKLDTQKPINVICGYRSKKTNDSLRGKSKGVAKNSKHMTGHAIDFNITGQKLKDVRNCALSFKAGGVGYYLKSGFVHTDIRDKPAVW